MEKPGQAAALFEREELLWMKETSDPCGAPPSVKVRRMTYSRIPLIFDYVVLHSS
jgi:hypothetical protein